MRTILDKERMEKCPPPTPLLISKYVLACSQLIFIDRSVFCLFPSMFCQATQYFAWCIRRFIFLPFFVIFLFLGGGGGGASRTGVSMWNQEFNKRFTVNEKRMSKQLTFKYFLSWQPIMIIAMNEFFEKSSTQVNLRPLLSVLTMDALAIPNKKWKFKKKKLRTS